MADKSSHSRLTIYVWCLVILVIGAIFYVFRAEFSPHDILSPQKGNSPVIIGGDLVPAEEVEPSGNLSIRTTPAGAVVMVDGEKRGVSPLTLPLLSLGKHQISISKSCYNKVKQEFLLGDGSLELAFTLDSHCGQLEVVSEPSGCKILVNGKRYGITPHLLTGVRAGDVDVQVRFGEVVLQKNVRIKIDKTAKAKFAFARPVTSKHGFRWQDPQTGIAFIWVDGGCYDMGNRESEKLFAEIAKRKKHRLSSFFKDLYTVVTDTGEEEEVLDFDIDEGPVHEVCLNGLWVGQHEVTNKQYLEFSKATGIMPEWLDDTSEYHAEDGENEYYKTLGGDSLGDPLNPVVGVNWHDALRFGKWFSEKTGYPARLLTEAEWEYVCRSGGQDEKFAGGDDAYSVAWYADNSEGRVHEVGQLQANGIGFFDLSGNAWEWTMDHYGSESYVEHEQFNPVYQGDGVDPRMVVRGGSWRSREKSLRCTARYGLPAADTNVFLGFRIVMEGEGKK